MKHIFIVVLLMSLWAGVGVVSAQGDVDLDLGDIPAGQQVTITYEASVNETLPEGLRFITNQGVVTSDNFPDILSDDPANQVDDDETLTPVGFTLPVIELPNTGESPWYRMLLTSAIVSLIVAVAGGYFYHRQTQTV